MFESFSPMNTSRNEVSPVTPEQVAAAEAILKGSELSLEDPKKEGVAHFGGELNVHLMEEKKAATPGAIRGNPFDEAGLRRVDDDQVKKAEAFLKDSGLTLQ